MAGIENNLYPPILATWMPAFVRTTTCKVYFSLSIYNNINDIANAQVTLVKQANNRSILNETLYPTGIKICDIYEDYDRQTNDRYYIEIDPEDLKKEKFGFKQFYKIQIRFTSIYAGELPPNEQIAPWLNENQKYFSEWSTVCLIKPIERPEIYLRGFTDNSDSIVLDQEIVDLAGYLYYPENGEFETETLKYYNVTLYNTETGEKVYSSEDIYTNTYNPNEINYTLKVHLKNNTSYQLIFEYTTFNEYKNSVKYDFSISQSLIPALSATIKSTLDTENGRVKININGSWPSAGDLIIRRASSEDNYLIWEDVHQISLGSIPSLDYTWYDYTIESGVFYEYGAQKRDSQGKRGELIITEPIMINLDDMFLTRANMQFRIKFDPSISNFKYTYSETKIDTLGSQYPYFYRNGNIKYKQFSISGLITSLCDDEGIFLNKTNIYKWSKDKYDSYNKEENISEYRDYIYERKFREKILDFLYADDVKLFRSPTEGNILVRLMDISLTPNQTLGRMLYSFTANAYEIDKCSLENYQKYGIQLISNTNNL